jgi:hypothetical protein
MIVPPTPWVGLELSAKGRRQHVVLVGDVGRKKPRRVDKDRGEKRVFFLFLARGEIGKPILSIVLGLGESPDNF